MYLTRIAVLADIHGNLPALEAVIADMQRFAPDAVIVAGDLINLAPFSGEVLTRVFDLGWAVIRGNHEFYLLDYDTPRAPARWHDYTTPRWLNATISPALKQRVATLPDTLTLYYPDAPPLRIIHGFPHTHWDGIYPSLPDEDVARNLASVAEETVVCGHVHLTQERRVQVDGRCWHVINPGSVGLPEDGLPGTAPYALLDGDTDGWHATYRRPAYDQTALLAALDAPAYRAAHGPFARLYAEEFRTGRVCIWPFQDWRKQVHPDAPVSDALVDQWLALGDAMMLWTHVDFRPAS
ncbi:MAG: metallophosphoesterase family protein [Chloroflexota bacterium]|nr:metallophosphoesterase family protein [Chloroflexota bacterium]